MRVKKTETKPAEEALRRYLSKKISEDLDPRELRRRGDHELDQMVDVGLPFVRTLGPGERRLRIANVSVGGKERTVVQLLMTDCPFLVDSFRLNLARLGMREKVLVHPSLLVDREEDGSAAMFGPGASGREAYIYAEVSPLQPSDWHARLEAELGSVFGQIEQVVSDHGKLVKTLRKHTADIEFAAEAVDTSDRATELMDFLGWLADDNFVFFGYRRYDFRRRPTQNGVEIGVELDPTSGLGLMRDPATSRFAEALFGEDVPALIRSRVEDPRLVFFDKSHTSSIIHREGRLDSISIKLLDDDGRVSGFGKFIGLLTHKAVRTPPSDIPIIRKRRERLLTEIGAEPGSHTYKGAIEAFNSLPLEFLFPFELKDVQTTIERVMRAAESRTAEIVVIPDPFNRSFFVSAILPRSTYRENLRTDLRALFVEKYNVSYLDHRSTFLDDEAALIHFFCTKDEDPEAGLLDELEQDVLRCSMRWEDRFEASLLGRFSEEKAYRLADEYGRSFPEEYRIATTAEHAHRDVEFLECVRQNVSRVELAFWENGDAKVEPARAACLKIYQRERPYLTDLLPMLDHFGLRAIDARLTEVRCHSGENLWIGAFDVERTHEAGASLREREERVVAGLRNVLTGVVEADQLNCLIFGVGLDWREVDLVRAYFAYAAQIGYGVSRAALADTMLRHPTATRALLALFAARFDPEASQDRKGAQRAAQKMLAVAREPIKTAEEDRVFALLEELIRATVRSSYYAPQDGDHMVVFKLHPKKVATMPRPRPFAEIFVHSVAMSGVHLRGGPIARGGIRWSDRLRDFRTEIAGLMKTQMVKNGLIVPVGAKGGFVLRRRFDDPAEARAEADRQYARFIGALLRISDNTVAGEVVHPERVVCHDGDDPYLVVAADKGTAHLSDKANAVAEASGFWLGDAFASGGSDGYDHKAEGITARGAFTCAKRHFLELGTDIEREPFTAAGIGDMSGDVFGNGLLLARNARLLAAFDHRHVFIDPSPDLTTSWRERRRLFELPRSRWIDYDPDKISRGGGVFERTAKSIALSPEARAVLGVEAPSVSGDELVRAVLRMEVDLLWNGGVGTYVRASDETDAEVGDHTNDAVRIDATELRAKVVAEGGNLGLTQRARVEYATQGGCINMDAVDNSGGVDLSDLEVNYKILLHAVVKRGRITRDERNVILRDCAGQADSYVIAHSEAQSHGISMDLMRGRENPERMVLAARFLERNAGLDPQIEFLPTREELRSRATPDRPQAYTRPELAILLGYTKLLAKRELARSGMMEHASFFSLLEGYFPDRMRECFRAEIESHPLRAEITATCLTNRVIDRAGVTLIPELVRTHGKGVGEIVVAYFIMDSMLEAEHLRWAIERQDVPESVRLKASRWVESVVRAATRSRLGLESRVLLEPEEISHWTGMVRTLRECMRGHLGELERARIDARAAELTGQGIGCELAREIAELPFIVRSLGVISLSLRMNAPLALAARIHAEIGRVTRVNWLLDRLGDLERRDGWNRVAAESLVLELLEAQRRLTRRVLETDPEGSAVETFRSQHAVVLGHIDEAAQEIEAEERRGLAPLAVLSQLIRHLA